MQSINPTSTSKNRTMCVALTLVIGVFANVLLIESPACAQGYDAGQAGYLGQAQGLSPDQDSFLPPEVVPGNVPFGSVPSASPTPLMDSQIGTAMNAPINPSSGGTQGMSMGATPGLLDSSSVPAAGTSMNMNAVPPMSYKDMRKAAFESLMNNQQLSSQTNNMAPPKQSTFGQFQPAQGAPMQGSPVAGGPLLDPMSGGTFSPGQPGLGQLGQPDWLIMGNNKAPNPDATVSQTQTLTAGSKVPITRRDTRRGGLANNISGFGGLGAGLLTGLVRRPNSLFGLGLTGITMTGFGVRNGFRY